MRECVFAEREVSRWPEREPRPVKGAGTQGHERKPLIAFSRPTISGFAIPMSPNQVRQVTMSFPPHAVICNGNTPDLPFWPLAYAYPCRSDIASQSFIPGLG